MGGQVKVFVVLSTTLGHTDRSIEAIFDTHDAAAEYIRNRLLQASDPQTFYSLEYWTVRS